jgi:copper chaperone CopZ
METPQTKPSAKAIFSLFNLGCSGCSALLEKKLGKMLGVRNVTVNYITDTVLVSYDPTLLGSDDIRSFMRRVGYDSTA